MSSLLGAFQRGAQALNSSIEDRYGYPGMPIQATPFDAQNYSAGAELAKLGTSLIGHARAVANSRMQMRRLADQDALVRARIAHYQQLSQGKPVVGSLSLQNPMPAGVEGPPDPNDTTTLEYTNPHQLFMDRQSLATGGMTPLVKMRLGMEQERLQLLREAAGRGADTQSRLEAGAFHLAHQQAANSWQKAYVDRQMQAFDAQHTGDIAAANKILEDPHTGYQDAAAAKSKLADLAAMRKVRGVSAANEARTQASALVSQSLSGDLKARAALGVPSTGAMNYAAPYVDDFLGQFK
jgi:hypothetical protein